MPQSKKPVTAAKQKKFKDWLKSKGHNASKVNAADFTDTSKLKAAMCDLHGVSIEQYKAAGGKPEE